MRSNRKKMFSEKPVLTVDKTSRSCWSISSPRWDACMRAIGFPMSSSRETNQSMAFFNPPGMALTYSGLAMIMPSLSRMRSANFWTGSGKAMASKSGEKTGKSLMQSNTIISSFAPATADNARSIDVLVEAARPLPDIAKIFMAQRYVSRRFGATAALMMSENLKPRAQQYRATAPWFRH